MHKPILYAEDNPDDVFFMIRACKHAGIEPLIHTVPSGEEAIRYLAGDGKYGDRQRYPQPQLVLLDLHMPGQSGFEVLQWIRRQPALASTPVLALTASSDSGDIERASELGANGYLVKPGNLEELVKMTKALRDYWLSQDQLARKREATQTTEEVNR